MIKLYTSRADADAQQSTTAGGVDAAFLATSVAVLRTVPLAWRQQPSAAPSPILTWILRAAQQQQQQQHTFATASNDKGSSSSSSGGGGGDSLAAVLLARRGGGMARKDPLLERLAKKQARAAAAAAAAATSLSSGGNPNINANSNNTTTTTSTTTAAVEVVDVTPSHWSRRLLSAMTAAGWAVFREQLGIEVEAVNRRPTGAAAKPSAETLAVSPSDSNINNGNWGGGMTSPPPPSASPSATATTSTPGAIERVYSVDMAPPLRCWEEAGLPYTLGRAVAARYALPTAVQSQCVPLAMKAVVAATTAAATPSSSCEGNNGNINNENKKVDVIGVAETGSGKTVAYLVPMLAGIRSNRRPNFLTGRDATGADDIRSHGPLALVLVPTRELAEQATKELSALLGLPDANTTASNNSGAVDKQREEHRSNLLRWEQEELASLLSSPGTAAAAAAAARHTKEHNLLSEVRVLKIVGGESEEAQYQSLLTGAHIVIGTVGQVNGLLDRRLLALGNTACIVIDEADRMIAENQQSQLVGILSRCPVPRQTMLFTATLDAACADIARNFLSPDGYVLVRTPHRCASIRQNFEIISLDPVTAGKRGGKVGTGEDADGDEEREDGSGKKHDKRDNKKKTDDGNEQQQRRMSPLVHRGKFARLVAWLAYATGPIVVFAGEKRTCDALQDELRLEREALLVAEGERASIESLVGPPPPGLLFVDDVDDNDNTATATHVNNSNSNKSGGGGGVFRPFERATHRRHALEAAAASRARLSLENLSSVAVVHSELSQAERRRLVDLFRTGQRRVLVTTDLLARGLDVPGLTLVINYDMPWPAPGGLETPANAVVRYIHRIGRTGRAGRIGVTVSFVALPAELVTRARQSTSGGGDGRHSRNGTTNKASSSFSSPGVNAISKVYAPGASEAVKSRDRELSLLTSSGSGGGGGGGFGIDEDDIDRADDYTSGGDNDNDGHHHNGGDGDQPDRKRGRRLEAENSGGGSGAGRNKEKSGCRGGVVFASDEVILKPLWEFLCKCVSANCLRLTTAEEAQALLLRRVYGKIDAEPALAALMAERAAQGSRFGVIRT